MSNLKSTYKILPSHNLLIEYHTGILDLDSYINFKKNLFKDSSFKPNLNHFIHFKNVSFTTDKSDINKFLAFMKSNSQTIGNRKIAFITNTPNQVVLTTIYKLLHENHQTVEIFSTNENALKWLNIKILDYKKIITVISKIK